MHGRDILLSARTIRAHHSRSTASSRPSAHDLRPRRLQRPANSSAAQGKGGGSRARTRAFTTCHTVHGVCSITYSSAWLAAHCHLFILSHKCAKCALGCVRCTVAETLVRAPALSGCISSGCYSCYGAWMHCSRLPRLGNVANPRPFSGSSTQGPSSVLSVPSKHVGRLSAAGYICPDGPRPVLGQPVRGPDDFWP